MFALAVGIVLGAGPLQNSIGNALSGEVDSLREANSELKRENEKLAKTQAGYVTAFEEIAPTLLEGILPKQSIAIITLPHADGDDVKQVQEKVALTGAGVSGVYEIQPAWTSADNTAFRSSFAEQIKTYVPAAKDASDANTIIALALAQIVKDGTEAETNKTLAELMTGADTALLKVLDGGKTAATSVIFVSPDTPDLTPKKGTTQDPDQVAQADYDTKTFGALVKLIGEKLPSVLGGYANSQNDLVLHVRTSGAGVSSVDALNGPLGVTNVLLAVAAELKDQTVAYGFAQGAQEVVGKRIIVEAPAPTQPAAATPPAEG
ncbi:copper transporter [Arcanobacterium hippocoleae]